jgi:hypothetical protein
LELFVLGDGRAGNLPAKIELIGAGVQDASVDIDEVAAHLQARPRRKCVRLPVMWNTLPRTIPRPVTILCIQRVALEQCDRVPGARKQE